MIIYQVEKCPENREDWRQLIGIYPVGLRENLTIDLTMLCDCQCERPGDPVRNQMFFY